MKFVDLYPLQLVMGFHALCHALCGCHLGDDAFQPLLCLFVQISQICLQLAAKDKDVEPDGMMFFEVIQMLPAPGSDRSVLRRESQTGKVVVACQNVIQPVFHDDCLHFTNLVFRICHTEVPMAIGVVVV